MNLICVICSELLVPSDDIFHTPCGHIFHYACLLQWLERSKTCPQCRVITTTRTIHRIYFNFSNNDNIAEDAASLQNKIDNLNFQLKLKDKNLSNLTEDNDKLKNQTAGLRHKIYEVESEIVNKNSAIHAFKDQIKFYKQQSSNAENDRKENEELKKKLKFLKSVQNLIDEYSTSNVEDITMQTDDVSKLRIYIGILKKELDSMREKSKELRNKCKMEQQIFMQLSRKNKFLVQKCAKQNELKQHSTELEEQLKRCETEKISLQTQLFNMQIDAQKCICNKISVQQESYEQENLKEHKESYTVKSKTMNEYMPKMEYISKLKKSSSINLDDSTENIPSNKLQDFFSIRDHGIKRHKFNNNLKIPSTLVKKSRIDSLNQKTASGSGMSFDGFGGHAKYDKFPNPIVNSHIKKNREDPTMSKSKYLDTGDNQKISDLLIFCTDL
ncbi:PREDICTED: E3 ubiquitin-protein ligase TRAIP-like [Acromyrmex echinatior]|uniref:E3 ubiquitin-protein ligase TRAIP-like n=1 Tax=Acromyrmex echinatior TaxID=103372 RepID=UPI000580C1C7|nr:PREDICTED: E3 ubiquitin-protein ligase TRAIP-like [Acromyrmex echinatior]XP_011065010.1 PREDICTED: E3 ubiquitin-protein ligase TRAIP-like [Acromyrmex echinatior]XP_011065012.1 PREDICTED: E3 ubiquitin-protein ligase TRAIP-like [Acromyrmex echinatior]